VTWQPAAARASAAMATVAAAAAVTAAPATILRILDMETPEGD
jgi:hypothetical protein